MLEFRPNDKNIKDIPPEGKKGSCLPWTVHCGIVETGRMDTCEGKIRTDLKSAMTLMDIYLMVAHKVETAFLLVTRHMSACG